MNEIERAIKDFEKFKQAGYTHSELPSSWNIELALAALRAELERAKGCDFCLNPDGDNSIYIDHTHRTAITTHDVYVPISYCPMCGKSLKEETHD